MGAGGEWIITTGSVEVTRGKTMREYVQYLRCLYLNARSFWNKEEELEVLVHKQNYDAIGIKDLVG